MSAMTYYVILPFVRDEDGELVPLEPVEAQSSEEARRRANATSASKGGAIAFSRTGDSATGDFEEAVLLGRYGDVPTDLMGMAG